MGTIDFGRQPAALIGQCLRSDWFVQREFWIGRDVSACDEFPRRPLKAYLARQYYPGFTFNFWVSDPDGPAYRGRGAGQDAVRRLFRLEHGIDRAAGAESAEPAHHPMGSRQRRADAPVAERWRSADRAMLVDGTKCPTFITGMSGGYYMRRIRVSGERYADEPEKNQYSHICEAGENMLLGGGEGREVTMGGRADARPDEGLRRPQDHAPE